MTPEITHDKTQILIDEIRTFSPSVNIVRAVSKRDGVKKMKFLERKKYATYFKKKVKTTSFTNFIPASGSGSRMFKVLTRFCHEFDPEEERFSTFVNRTNSFELSDFFKDLKKFPFYHKLKNKVLRINELSICSDEKKLVLARYILDDLKLSETPKALQLFHTENNTTYTAFEEQIRCHEEFSKDFYDANITFTIDKSYEPQFLSALYNTDDSVKVQFSFQQDSTKVICVNRDYQLVQNEDGTQLFRPGGHGALLQNLNKTSAAVIHIHNIDNVPVKKLQKSLVHQRKLLCGYLLFVRDQIYKYLQDLENDRLSKKALQKFLKKYLNINLDAVLQKSDNGLYSAIYNLLNKPIRICGVVKNKNQVGGGPFWVLDSNDCETLQIVESTEINKYDTNCQSVLKSNAYFNPVEIFCCIKDYKGNTFDLNKFCCKDSKILVEKTDKNKSIQYLEHPGLWNGSMKYWNTFFVEMDSKLFNPVKSVNDLLNVGHQS